MIVSRPSSDRGHFDFGWLRTYHTFSFGDYSDPEHNGFHALRVINEDYVQAARGFDAHSHRDMEIITYVLEGSVEHQDSLGTRSVIRPGEVQRMTAGRGVTHSEKNPSKTEVLHLLQIWLLPQKKGLEPGYEQRFFDRDRREGKFCLLASGKGRGESLKIHQDVDLFACVLNEKKTIPYTLSKKRAAWIQVARGSVELNGHFLNAGDGAAVENESELFFVTKANAEFLLFDLA